MIDPLEALLRLHEMEFKREFANEKERKHALAEIERCRVELDDDLLERYDMLKEHFGEKAIVTIEKNTCTGCCLALPMSGLKSVASDIYICEHCGRLLYDSSYNELGSLYIRK